MIFTDVLGYVLAGGESSRMQRPDLPEDKALLMLGGCTLLERALARVADVCPDPRILCGTSERCTRLQKFGPTVADRVTQAGPLGGLHAALQEAHDQGAARVLVVPVDLPWMPSLALSALAERALASGAAVACMQAEGSAQPLPVVLSTEALPLVTQYLEEGKGKLLPVLRDIALRFGDDGAFVLDAAELGLNIAPERSWFRNVNTPEEFAAAQRDETLASVAHQSKHGG